MKKLTSILIAAVLLTAITAEATGYPAIFAGRWDGIRVFRQGYEDPIATIPVTDQYPGLTYDGEYLWVAYGEAFTMAYYKYDVNTGSIVDGIGGLAGSMPETPSIAVDDNGYIYCLYCDRTSSGGGYYYIFEPNGDDIYYFLDEGFLNHGMDVGAWPVTSITPTSLGTIKALYK